MPLTYVMNDPSNVFRATDAIAKFSARPLLVGVAVWTVFVGLSAGINYQNREQDAFNHARYVAEAYMDKDIAVRRWITGHGGIYVKPTERTPPNEWLTVPNRDVVTTGGQALTLVNPAYATRQLLEEFASEYGIRGHLTALQLKNPNNAPDAWERAALQRLSNGEKLIMERVMDTGAPMLRVMRPVYMEKGCLRCHADMNIPIGGLRGGLSTAVPMEPFIAAERAGVQKGLATHGLIWLVGLIGIGFNVRRSLERHKERAAAMALAQREDRRIAEVLSMSERLESLSEREIVQEGLEAGARLTSSPIGFFHFINEDQNSIDLVAWTKATLDSYCTAAYDSHYPIEKAGIWADCARLHQPVIHNDYPSLVIKRGLPEGHAPLQRLVSVPVIEGGRVRVITGVGNKEQLYDEHDVRLLQLLANDVWKLIQRKRADIELRESERSLREAQRLARMGSWTLDHASGEMNWSNEMYSVFGIDPLVFRPTRENVGDLVHPDDWRIGEAAFAKALAERREYQIVQRVPLADGRMKLVQFRAMTEYGEDGKPLRTTGTAQDVTEKQEVELLRRSEANLTALFEHTDRLIWSVDAQCRLVVGNTLFIDGMRRIIGRELLPGEPMPPPELPQEVRDHWHEHYQRALTGEKFSTELEVMGLAESPRWIDFSFYPIVDEDTGVVRGVTVFGRDYTEHRQMEETQIRTLGQMARMVRELEMHHDQSVRVNHLNDLLQSCRGEAEAHDVIALSAGEIFSGRTGCLSLVTPSGTELERVACWGEQPCVGLSFGIDDCWALRRGEPHEVRRPGELSCAHFDHPPAHGYLCLPLVVRGETLGLLTIEYPPDAAPEEIEDLREQVRTVGETIKLSLSNLRLRVALQEQATHDTLTGLFNRRYLDETLPRELHRIERAGGRLAVAMLDIDHFKRFNDSMGHEAGDLVLREIGQLLRDKLRKSDIGCRYGGEELMVILPDSGAEDARSRLADICDQIRSMRIGYRGGVLPTVTVSVGIAATNHHHANVAALLRTADDALYAAKEAGRDRIVIGGATAA